MKKRLKLRNDYLLSVSKLAALLLATAGNASTAAAWSETVLHPFAGGTTDGANPYAGLAIDPTGNLYGATCGGGASGQGVVFEIPIGGTYTLLYSFLSGGNGACPLGTPLLLGGNIYGTAENASVSGGVGSGNGVVYQLTPNPTPPYNYKVLHTFGGAPNDGATPIAALIADMNNNLYGTTFNGGTYKAGTVFKLTWNGTSYSYVAPLHSFAGGSSDGASPYAGLILDSAGYLYGVTALVPGITGPRNTA